MGLKKKDLQRMLDAALQAKNKPSEFEQQYRDQLGKMDAIVASKDYRNLPTEFAPDFHDVAAEQKKREQFAGLHSTGIGAWNSGGGDALNSQKEYNTNLYLDGIRGANDAAVKNFINSRNQLRSGLMTADSDRSKDYFNSVFQMLQNRQSQPSFWGQLAKSAIGTGLSIAGGMNWGGSGGKSPKIGNLGGLHETMHI